MDSQQEQILQDFQDYISKKVQLNVLQYEISSWNFRMARWVKKKIQIKLSEKNEIEFIMSESILQKTDISDIFEMPQLLTNMEQIKYLKWLGKYGDDRRKIGQWRATWQREILLNVGGFYDVDGQKQGLWKELIQNFWSEAQVFQIGEYWQSKKIGIWRYIYKDNIIGGGRYNEKGLKNGKWIDLSHRFWNQNQLMYVGEYINDLKVGQWEIWYKKYQGNKKLIQIGGGSYIIIKGVNGIASSQKIGIWVEFGNSFFNQNPVTYYGQYRYGRKVGQWDIWLKSLNIYCRDEKIGGGQYCENSEYYDCNMESIKIGRWIELNEENCLFTYNGEYKNGRKVGKWDIYYRNNRIGGGQYDEEEQIDSKKGSVKFGRWIELSDAFSNDSFLTQNGEYKNGRKVGKWDIFYCNNRMQLSNDNIFLFLKQNWIIKVVVDHIMILRIMCKIGKWIELSDGFYNLSQVTYVGEYIEGKKVGRWDICWNWGVDQKIAGGSYDDSRKIGQWIELCDGFSRDYQVTYTGSYEKGRKVGRWDTLYSNQLFGGGSYDEIQDCSDNAENSIKTGDWIELSDRFYWDNQIALNGTYKNGRKIGLWYMIDLDGDKIIDEIKYDG
ncbi:unnamed protein product [Paramecium sonneborni]|uniref:Uncharacterized protein n=1 Tax=Paramecium sonneborni TaxID=65129 RepID=A0A8S1R0L7_9CILI|nr:unnamed protein product [Paramecium sonneborni]